MTAQINAMPPWLAAIAYGLLMLGVLFVAGFIVDYVTHTARIDVIGRHMIAMSANVGAFFALYLAMAVWPDLPGRNAIRFGLFIAIVANCGWRWYLYRKDLKLAQTAPPGVCFFCGSVLKE